MSNAMAEKTRELGLIKRPIEELLIKNRLERLFTAWNESEGVRDGHVHASTILSDDFCFRQNVLAQFFQQEVRVHNPHLLAIFLNGWFIHERLQDALKEGMSEALAQHIYEAMEAVEGEPLPDVVTPKWQFLLGEIGGLADEVEQTHYHVKWGLSFTPDAVIRMQAKPYVVEIKGYKEEMYLKVAALADPMANAEFRKAATQANLYMFLLEIPQAIILWENKNTQDYFVRLRAFDPEMAQPYVSRLRRLKNLVELFQSSGKLPTRVCGSPDDERAKVCPLRKACFATKAEREALRRT